MECKRWTQPLQCMTFIFCPGGTQRIVGSYKLPLTILWRLRSLVETRISSYHCTHLHSAARISSHLSDEGTRHEGWHKISGRLGSYWPTLWIFRTANWALEHCWLKESTGKVGQFNMPLSGVTTRYKWHAAPFNGFFRIKRPRLSVSCFDGCKLQTFRPPEWNDRAVYTSPLFGKSYAPESREWC